MIKKSKIRDDYYNDNYSDDNNYDEYEESYENDEYGVEEDYEEQYDSDREYDEDMIERAEHYRRERESKKYTNHGGGRKSGKKVFRRGIKLCALALAAIIAFIVVVGAFMSVFIPAKTTFLIMATDEEGTRTDTIMLGSFDKKTKAISLLSVPRDTYVTVSDTSYELMNKDYPQPGSQSMKINAVHHYGGEKYGTELIINELGNLLGVDIDFYVKVDFEAFRYIIDSVGGIDFYVPQNMKYSDPVQNLYIDLQEGMQHLNGAQAEQVLRFRSGYANADIGRVSVQQDFMKAFISQALSPANLATHPGAFVNAIFKYGYVETNAGIFDMVSYAMRLGGVDVENIQTRTLPGTPAMRGGQSVYLLNEAQTQTIMSEFTGK